MTIPWLASLALAPGAVADVEGVTMTAMIDGRSVADATERLPIELRPDQPAALAVRVENETDRPVEVRTVRLAGWVMGLTFFAYDTSVGLSVPPRSAETRRFSLDLGGLDGQATGLLQGSVILLDAQREVVASQPLVVDVRGSMRSVYGAFGVVVAALTVGTFLGAVVALARNRLHANRWRRALRFLTPGVGLGLLTIFTLSATRVFVPRPDRWAPILLVSSVVLFVGGYLTPTPTTGPAAEDDDEEDEDDERGDDAGDADWAGAAVTVEALPVAEPDTR